VSSDGTIAAELGGAGARAWRRPVKADASAQDVTDFGAHLLIWGATAISVILFLLNTRHGIGILPDSTRYMGINDHPYDAPLYPFALRIMTMLGFGMVEGAKMLGLVLVAANTALLAALLLRTTKRWGHAAMGTALVIALPPFVTLHATAMSEPLFLLFILLSLYAFLYYLETERRAWLVGCGAMIGLCSLARFTAPPLGAAVALTLLLNPRHDMRRRFQDIAILAAVSAGIFFAWCIPSQLVEGHSIGRELRFFGNMGRQQWFNSMRTMAAWILPDEAPLALRAGLLVTMIVAGSILIARHFRSTLARARHQFVTDDLLPITLTFFFVFYMAFMLLSTSIEANLSLNSRYAFPAYVGAALLLTIVVARTEVKDGLYRRMTGTFGILAAIILAGHVLRTAIRTEDTFRSGYGYSSVAWSRSPTLAWIAALPSSDVIYSNGPDAVAYVIGRPAHFTPHHVLLRTGEPDPAYPYPRQVADLRQSLSIPGTYVVFLDRVDWRFYLASERELVRTLNLRLVASEPDGRIYTSQTVGED
jgi:hypothetical protein